MQAAALLCTNGMIDSICRNVVTSASRGHCINVWVLAHAIECDVVVTVVGSCRHRTSHYYNSQV